MSNDGQEISERTTPGGSAGASTPPPDRSSPAEQPAIDVQQLLRGGNEARLIHQGVVYRLRVTRQGKLLLTQ
jgi:hemin uptake protein HemP